MKPFNFVFNDPGQLYYITWMIEVLAWFGSVLLPFVAAVYFATLLDWPAVGLLFGLAVIFSFLGGVRLALSPGRMIQDGEHNRMSKKIVSLETRKKISNARLGKKTYRRN